MRAARATGFSAGEMRAAGFSAAEMRDAGYTVKEMRECGVTVRELREVYVSDAELTAAGFRVLTLRAGQSQATGQVEMSCYDQDGIECGSVSMDSECTFKQMADELEGHLG